MVARHIWPLQVFGVRDERKENFEKIICSLNKAFSDLGMQKGASLELGLHPEKMIWEKGEQEKRKNEHLQSDIR